MILSEQSETAKTHTKLHRLLIISPHFPPVNGADMHRVRTSLRYYREFGFDPLVLAVEPASIVQDWTDPDLVSSLPDDVQVQRVKAWPYGLSRWLGISAIGLRAYQPMRRAGRSLIAEWKPDIALFSTTAFPLMVLGRYWKRNLGVPYVLDMQDPWVTDKLAPDAKARRGVKHRLMRRLHRSLEPRAMKNADGLMAVAQEYIDALHLRYPVLRNKPSRTIRFGVSPRDGEIARARQEPHGIFDSADRLVHGVCVGAYSAGMEPALRALFLGLREGIRTDPSQYKRIRLHFVGTNYAASGQVDCRVQPLAEECGVGEQVEESPVRIPFYKALQVQQEADFLVLPGSTERGYVPSRLAGLVTAGPPILAICEAGSAAAEFLHSVSSAVVATHSCGVEASPEALHRCLETVARRASGSGPEPCDSAILEPILARELTRQQCELFEEVINCVEGNG